MKLKAALFLLAGLLAAAIVYAETIELVTYYPSPGGGNVEADRLHADRATIGDPYSLDNPPDEDLPNGTLLVAGAVGIGTAAPQADLDIYRQDEAYLRVSGTGINAAPENFSGLELGGDLPAGGAIDRVWQLAHKRGGAGAVNDLHVNYFDGAAWSTKLAFQPGGNVGIGTNNPEVSLHVSSGIQDIVKLTRTGVGGGSARIGYDALGLFLEPLAGGIRLNGNNPNLGVFVDGPTGKVGVGTTAPQYKLDVVGAGDLNQSIYSRATNDGMARLGVANTVRHWSISGYGTVAAPFASLTGAFAIADETAGVQRLVIDTSGNVGIGTLSPIPGGSLTQHLTRGSTGHRLAFTGWYVGGGPGGAPYLEYSIDNNALFGITSWPSSREVKTDITNLVVDTSRIYDLAPVSFYYKDYLKMGGKRGDVKAFGFVAEEVEKYFPQLIMRSEKENKIIGMDYGRLPVLMLPEMKKLKEENLALRAEVETLKARLDRLEQSR